MWLLLLVISPNETEVQVLELKDCESIGQFFFDFVMIQYISLVEISTNNGSKFCNALMDISTIVLCTKHTITSFYHLQCNRLLDRFNQILYLFIIKNRKYDEYWHTMLPMIIFVYCKSVFLNTRFFKFEMLYGHKSQISIVPLNLASTMIESIDIHIWLHKLLQHWSHLQAHAHNNINKTQQFQKKCHVQKKNNIH